MEKILSSQEQNQLGEIKAQIKGIEKTLDSFFVEDNINENNINITREQSFKTAKLQLKTALLFIEDGLKH